MLSKHIVAAVEVHMGRKLTVFGSFGIAVTAAILGGCGSSQNPQEKNAIPLTEDKTPSGNVDEHGHKPASHGGIIVPLGRDSYHIEVVFSNAGIIRLYMLGKDETRIQEVDVQELIGFVAKAGSTDATEMKFKASPQKGDAGEKTSLFVGTLPKEAQGKTIEITINNIQIGGERFRLAFTNEKAPREDDIPDGTGGDEAEKLYRAPGGKYTSEDIQANGKLTPAQKYKGVTSAHDTKPKQGDKICPISMSKSNPKLIWIIGGKSYEFCCLPCIDEFVRTAKERPNEVLDPSAYVKK
jgi:hypothetical protein